MKDKALRLLLTCALIARMAIVLVPALFLVAAIISYLIDGNWLFIHELRLSDVLVWIFIFGSSAVWWQAGLPKGWRTYHDLLGNWRGKTVVLPTAVFQQVVPMVKEHLRNKKYVLVEKSKLPVEWKLASEWGYINPRYARILVESQGEQVEIRARPYYAGFLGLIATIYPPYNYAGAANVLYAFEVAAARVRAQLEEACANPASAQKVG